MPTTTWAIGRDEIARELGFEDFATTTNITTNNSIISTGLADRYAQNDFFNGWFAIIESGNNVAVIRRVTDYVASSGTLTVAGAVLASESGAVNCALHRFHPDDILRAYNRARQDLYPVLHSVEDYQIIVTGQRQYRYIIPSGGPRRIDALYIGSRSVANSLAENLFDDGGFEDWTNTTTLAQWTLAGASASVNQEVETTTPKNYAVMQDQYSARIVVPLNTVTTLLQTVTPSVATEGVECNVSVWVYCNTASRVSVRIRGFDGTAHGGTGWELLTHSQALEATATSVVAGIAVSSGAAIPVFVDEAIITLGQSEEASEAWTPLHNWQFVAPINGANNAGHIDFPYMLPEKHRLRILGRDYLDAISSDAGTIAIDGDLLDLLYNQCRRYLAAERATGIGKSGSFWQLKQSEFGNRVEVALDNGVGMSLASRQSFKIPDA